MLGINNDKLQNTHAKVYIIHNKLSRLQNHPGDPGSLLNLMKGEKLQFCTRYQCALLGCLHSVPSV